MPLAAQRWKPRFDVLFLSAIGCLVLTFSMLNLKASQPQASHSFAKLEKPSIRYGPYRGGENKRILEREVSPSRDHKDSSARTLVESTVNKSQLVEGAPGLRKAGDTPIENDAAPVQVKNGTYSIKQQTFVKVADTSSRANHTGMQASVNNRSAIVNDHLGSKPKEDLNVRIESIENMHER